MKKILLLILCLASWTQSFSQTDSNLTQKEKDEAWDFILRKYFTKGINEFHHPEKYYSDIYYFIVNGTKNDSLIIQDVIDEIDPIIPRKMHYATNREKANFIITLAEPKDSLHFSLDNKPKIENKNGYYNNAIASQYYYLEIPKKNHATTLRNIAVLGLSNVYQKEYDYLDESSKIHNSGLFIQSNAISYGDTKYSEISDFDKYIIKNLNIRLVSTT